MVVDEAVVSRFKLTLNPLVPIADTFRTGCVFQQNNVVMGRGLVVVIGILCYLVILVCSLASKVSAFEKEKSRELQAKKEEEK